MEVTEIKYDRHVESSLIGEYLNDCRFVKIPDNATNGDMIKAMFPYAIKSNYTESSLDMIDYVTVYLGDYEMRVSFDWWNASYKTESEDKE